MDAPTEGFETPGGLKCVPVVDSPQHRKQERLLAYLISAGSFSKSSKASVLYEGGKTLDARIKSWGSGSLSVWARIPTFPSARNYRYTIQLRDSQTLSGASEILVGTQGRGKVVHEVSRSVIGRSVRAA
jgi:hypothetical protein